MILVDTGPIIALFDPLDPHHKRCAGVLRQIRESLCTTVPVLTEAFHMLNPGSKGSSSLRAFILKGGCSIFFMDVSSVTRAFELMGKYADHPMDLADASLIVAAEKLRTRRVFTIDRNDFETYRVKRGHRYYHIDILG
ncbi:MAG: PIN domain-containing protein [Deltaproteobacteria bacterium]|nr:PIN domain-containing protein [Deltaproteobacteria bacterium]